MTNNYNFFKKGVSKTLAAIPILSTMLIPAFATAELTQKVNTISNNILGFITGIIFTLAGVALAICVLIWLLSKDEKKVQGAFEWGKRIVIGCILYLLIGAIISFASSLAG